MKKILVTLAIVAVAAISANAQELSAGAGYLNSTMKSTYGSSTTSVGAQGFYAGAGYAKSLSSLLSLSTGIYYSFLTSSSSASIFGLAGVNSKMKEHYFNIPVNINANIELAKGLSVFAFAGPMLNLGLASSTETTALVGSSTAGSNTTDNYGDKSNYGRLDVMVGGGAGIQYQTIKVFCGYNYGLLDRDKTDNTKIQRSELVAGVALAF